MALHILLADDSVPAQNMGKKILAEAGYDVTTVSNGLEALRKIADAAPDVAILDIFMPGYTGLEICQKLRANPATAALPVILTVGKLEPYRPEEGESVHSNAVIVKPFAAAELIAAVHSLVGDATSAQAPAADTLGAGPDHDAAPDDQDEPLFNYGSPATDETESLQSGLRAGMYGVDPTPGDTGTNDPHGLMFNPDAAHIPFSASAVDLLSSEPQAHPQADESPLTDFNQQSTESVYSGATEQSAPEILSAGFTSEAAEHVSEYASAPAPEAAAPEAPASFQIEPPAQEPLLEASGNATANNILDSNFLIEGELPENLVLEDFTETPADEPLPTAPQEPLSPEEEARLKAFEDLFNSQELPPLEESPAVETALHGDLLPNISAIPEEHAVEIQPDPELELFGHQDTPASPLIAQSDPELLQEEAPRSAIGDIPDRDVMLDHVEAPVSYVSQTPEELLPSFGEHFPAQDLTPFELEESAPTAVNPEATQQEAGSAALLPELETPAAPPEQEASPIAEESATPAFAEVAEPVAEVAALEPESFAVAAPEPATAGPEIAAQHVEAENTPEPEALPVAAAPEPTPAAPVEFPTPEPTPHVAEPEPVAPVAAESHSAVSEFAARASGAGLAAAIPALAHFVESEVHAFTHLGPASSEPERHEAAVPAPESHEASATAPEPVAAATEFTEQHPLMEPVPEPAPSEAEAPAHEFDHFETVSAGHSVGDPAPRSPEAERIHQAVERVFERFKPLLVAAIVRELARHE